MTKICCHYETLLFMPLVILHRLLNVFVQLANKRGFKKKMIVREEGCHHKMTAILQGHDPRSIGMFSIGSCYPTVQ
jgi:hypothetical protein